MSKKENGTDTALRANRGTASPALAKAVALHLEGKRKEAQSKLAQVAQESRRLVLLSPRDGVVIGLPSPEDVGKTVLVKGHADAATAQTTAVATTAQPDAPAVTPAQAPPPSQAP